MLTLLAQTAPDPKVLSAWLEVLFYLGGFAATVLGAAVAWRSLRTPAPEAPPQPFKVEAAEKFASHFEFVELKADVEQIRQDVQDGFRTLGDERRTSVGNLHGKIDATNTTVNQ
jgi:hypothetical protein